MGSDCQTFRRDELLYPVNYHANLTPSFYPHPVSTDLVRLCALCLPFQLPIPNAVVFCSQLQQGKDSFISIYSKA